MVGTGAQRAQSVLGAEPGQQCDKGGALGLRTDCHRAVLQFEQQVERILVDDQAVQASIGDRLHHRGVRLAMDVEDTAGDEGLAQCIGHC
jgi:hypothetical protein